MTKLAQRKIFGDQAKPLTHGIAEKPIIVIVFRNYSGR